MRLGDEIRSTCPTAAARRRQARSLAMVLPCLILIVFLGALPACGHGGGGGALPGTSPPPPPPSQDPPTVLGLVNPAEPPPVLASIDFANTRLATILPQIDPLTLPGSPRPRLVLGQTMLVVGELLDAATQVFVAGVPVPVQYRASAGGLDGILVHLPISLPEGIGRGVVVVPGGGTSIGPLPVDLIRAGMVLDVGDSPGVRIFDLATGDLVGSAEVFPQTYPSGAGLAAAPTYTGLAIERRGGFYMAVDAANRDLILGPIRPLPRDLNPGQFSFPLRLRLRDLVTAAYHGSVPPGPIDLSFSRDAATLTITFAGSSSSGVVVLDASVLDSPKSLASNSILGHPQAYGQRSVIVFSGTPAGLPDRVLPSPIPGIFLVTDDTSSLHVIDEGRVASRSLFLGKDPAGMAFASLAGGSVVAYVTLARENKVVWFDLKGLVDSGLAGTPVLTAAFASGSKPIDLAVRPQGDYALLCNAVTRDLTVFRVDPTDGSLGYLGSVPLGSGGLGSLAVSPDGAFAFVTAGAGGELLMVDLTNVGDPGQIPPPTPISLGGYPVRLALQPGT